MTERLHFHFSLSCIGEGNGNPLQCSCLKNPRVGGAWWATVHGVAKSWTRLSNFTFTFHFHALEKEMATHSSILAWRLPGTEEPVGLPSMGSHRVGHDWCNLAVAVEFTNIQSEPQALEVRVEVVCRWQAVTRSHEGVPGVLGPGLFIDLSAGYLDVFILWKFFELYTYNLCSFLCICYS